MKTDAIAGCLLGTAVGDAMGLPYEGLSPRRLRKFAPRIDRHRFLFNKGMVSDDTEQTCMVAQAILVAGGDGEKFAIALAWRLRFWLLGLPAGIGKGTLQACLKLWLGFPYDDSGVFSAGNGAAMRCAILGVCYGENLSKLRAFVRRCTRLTHSDPKAEWGALAVAIAAYLASTQSEIQPEQYLTTLSASLEPEAKEFLDLIESATQSASQNETGEIFAMNLGARRGISGYVYRTVPTAIQVWLRHQRDFGGGISEIVQLGGDTDTTAAILGGIIGASAGKQGIPQQWLDNLWEFPRTVEWMEKLGQRLAEAIALRSAKPALHLPLPGLVLRNLLFLMVVLLHGFRRLFPPY
ncbi:MAG: ADP-ribosylglycohydrolase family protein [Cyanobacteriota bacterium]|nr:ADP-ribosylglycohydrolase family protein [Cyanobacteriota bacterium]